jgi:toxin ParE1/3/4
MSVPRRRLILTPRAQAHLRAIRRYTVRQWGPQQYATYRAKLTAAMERLTEFPALGTDASHIAPGVHAFPVEQHVIFTGSVTRPCMLSAFCTAGWTLPPNSSDRPRLTVPARNGGPACSPF